MGVPGARMEAGGAGRWHLALLDPVPFPWHRSALVVMAPGSPRAWGGFGEERSGFGSSLTAPCTRWQQPSSAGPGRAAQPAASTRSPVPFPSLVSPQLGPPCAPPAPKLGHNMVFGVLMMHTPGRDGCSSPWAGVGHSLQCPKTLPRTPKPCPAQHSFTAISAGALGAPSGEPTGLFSYRASPPGCCLPPPPRPLQKAGGNEAGA